MENFSVDFIGVGGEKTASSWIFTCIKEHPQVCASNPKETDFFDDPDLVPGKIEGVHEEGCFTGLVERLCHTDLVYPFIVDKERDALQIAAHADAVDLGGW